MGSVDQAVVGQSFTVRLNQNWLSRSLLVSLRFPCVAGLPSRKAFAAFLDGRFKGMAVAHGAPGQVVVVVALCDGVGRFHVPIILSEPRPEGLFHYFVNFL